MSESQTAVLEVLFGAEIPAGATVELSPGAGLLADSGVDAAQLEKIELFRAEKIVVEQPRGFRILMVACQPPDPERHGLRLDDKGRAMQFPPGDGLPDLLFGPQSQRSEFLFDTCAPSTLTITVHNPTAEAMHFGVMMRGRCVVPPAGL